MATYTKSSVVDFFISRRDMNTLISTQPSYSSVYPDSSIRKYRAPYYGKRSSERINLFQQEILSDLYFCYNKLEQTTTTVNDLLYIASNINIPR